MNQKFALALAGVLTAFFLVMVGSIATMIIVQPAATQPTITQPIQSQPILTGQINIAANTISTKLNSDQAAQIAMNTSPRSTLTTTPELVDYQGIVAYEVKLNNATLYIDANTGKVLANSNSNTTVTQTRTTRNGEREHSEHEEDDDD